MGGNLSLQYGTFTAEVDNRHLVIAPEMFPAKDGISPSGRYFIYCIDPVQGSCHFIVEQDDNACWKSDFHPPFISDHLIARVGDQIESHNM